MRKDVWTVVEEIERFDERTDLKEPLWRISQDNGVFLNMLVRMSGATRVLEIGSSSGYSGLFLGEAAKANGGQVTTCELSPYKIGLARGFYEKAGLGEVISIVEGDARKSVRDLEGPWDFVFIDAEKDDYPDYLDAVWPKIVPGGVVVADDILSQAKNPGIVAYIKRLREMTDASTVTVPIDDGVELTNKLR